jgi:hypothetical protein
VWRISTAFSVLHVTSGVEKIVRGMQSCWMGVWLDTRIGAAMFRGLEGVFTLLCSTVQLQ